YQPFSFYLGGKRTYYGLPNNPDYDLGALIGSVCDTLTGISPLYPPKGDLINIYPNPVNNILFISGLSDAKNELVVYDIYGRLIIEKQTNGTNGSIDVSSLSDGVYNLRIKNEAGEYFKKRFVVIK
ncbi:MAG TPA: T9SS type A sorting domain-containing protein, partial [Spirochaetota bacterium]|nr:T9SS type A sorting domain-containing protein [Spirochaetota bacterium]